MKGNHFVYLAGPIDAAGEQSWREHATKWLLRKGVSCFCPWGAYAVPTIRAAAYEAILAINQTAIASSSAMLVVIPANTRTVGTYREIEIAQSMRVPVVAHIPGSEVFLSLRDVPMCASLDDALKRLWLVMRKPAPSHSILAEVSRLKRRIACR